MDLLYLLYVVDAFHQQVCLLLDRQGMAWTVHRQLYRTMKNLTYAVQTAITTAMPCHMWVLQPL